MKTIKVRWSIPAKEGEAVIPLNPSVENELDAFDHIMEHLLAHEGHELLPEPHWEDVIKLCKESKTIEESDTGDRDDCSDGSFPTEGLNLADILKYD